MRSLMVFVFVLFVVVPVYVMGQNPYGMTVQKTSEKETVPYGMNVPNNFSFDKKESNEEDKRIDDRLLQQLKSEDPDVRQEALEKVMDAPHNDSLRRKVQGLLGDFDPKIRSQAAELLGKWGNKHSLISLRARYERAPREPDDAVRRVLWDSIVSIEKKAITAQIQSGDKTEALQAVSELAKMSSSPEWAIDQLARIADEYSEPCVRQQALIALGNFDIKSERVLAVVREVAAKDYETKEVLGVAQIAIQRIELAVDKEKVAEGYKKLGSPDSSIRMEGVRLLVSVAYKRPEWSGVERLASLISPGVNFQQDVRVRLTVADALGKFGEHPSYVIAYEALRKAAENKEEESTVRSRAIKGSEKIRSLHPFDVLPMVNREAVREVASAASVPESEEVPVVPPSFRELLVVPVSPQISESQSPVPPATQARPESQPAVETPPAEASVPSSALLPKSAEKRDEPASKPAESASETPVSDKKPPATAETSGVPDSQEKPQEKPAEEEKSGQTGWFWQILAIAILMIIVMIIVIACAGFFFGRRLPVLIARSLHKEILRARAKKTATASEPAKPEKKRRRTLPTGLPGGPAKPTPDPAKPAVPESAKPAPATKAPAPEPAKPAAGTKPSAEPATTPPVQTVPQNSGGGGQST